MVQWLYWHIVVSADSLWKFPEKKFTLSFLLSQNCFQKSRNGNIFYNDLINLSGQTLSSSG